MNLFKTFFPGDNFLEMLLKPSCQFDEPDGKVKFRQSNIYNYSHTSLLQGDKGKKDDDDDDDDVEKGSKSVLLFS